MGTTSLASRFGTCLARDIALYLAIDQTCPMVEYDGNVRLSAGFR
jgi:hypothetical protein